MKLKLLSAVIACSLGLTACGGGGGGDVASAPSPYPDPGVQDPPAPSPSPVDVCSNIDGVQTTVPPGHVASGTTCTLVDACLNYEGEQTLAEVVNKGFVRDETMGTCRLERNHDSLSITGADVVRMMGYTQSNVPIAIVDGGFRPDHTEYVASVVEAVYYYDKNNNKIFEPNEKEIGNYNEANPYHGTAVAAQACGEKSGVLMRCNLYLKADDHGTNALTIKDTLVEGINIINNSTRLGVDGVIYWSALGNDPYGLISDLVSTQGVLVFGIGNDRKSISYEYDLMKPPQNKSCLDVPEEARHIVFVGVFDGSKNDLARYSNYPGYKKSLQDRFLVAGNYSFETASYEGPDAFSHEIGTSLASPQVAAAIALLMEAKPGLTAIEAAQVLLDTAQRPAYLGYGQTCSETTEEGTFTTDCGAMKFGRGLMDLPKALDVVRGM